MTTELIVMAYNEQFLMPFFLNHYKDIDLITVYLDADTTDDTKRIVEGYPNTRIRSFSFPSGMDDIIKTDILNQAYQNSSADFVFLVDADEFILDYQLLDGTKDVYFTKLYDVFRHHTETDLNPSLPIKEQRRHGVFHKMYKKPNIIKGGLPNFKWGLGIHECWVGDKHYCSWDSNEPAFIGSHWQMADPSYVVERRVKNRKERMSRSNLEKGLTAHHHNITEEQIRNELSAHENDPRVF